MTERVVALIDMDCFYVQVEERLNPENRGKPACVVQYKNWRGGGIIAVNYEARARGVKKSMRGDDAKEACPDIILYRVPEQRGKADLTKYRDAGKEVIDVMCKFGVCVERASIDEAYLDLTENVHAMLAESRHVDSSQLPNTFVVSSDESDYSNIQTWLEKIDLDDWSDDDWRLCLAAELVERMRAAVFKETGFRCSAGIAHNKMLAKLACGINKPNKQTVMPQKSVPHFFRSFPLRKVRHLGGKLGEILLNDLNCTTMGDVADIPERVLQQKFDDKTGSWLYWYSHGIDHEPVSSRRLPKSIGCNKNFSGIAALKTKEEVSHWLSELLSEVVERLEKDREMNKRTAKLLTLSIRLEGDSRAYSYSRAVALPRYDKKKMAADCMSVVLKENMGQKTFSPAITCIGVSASKFDSDATASCMKIDNFFSKRKAASSESSESESVSETEEKFQLPKQPAENRPNCEENLIEIHELFPDLSNVDRETLNLLPKELRLKVEEEIMKHKGSTSGISKCHICSKEISESEALEHSDFHLAENLQNSAASPPSSKLPNHRGRSEVRKPPAKRGNRTIDSFFKKT